MHSIVAPVVGAINPLQPVTIQSSVGNAIGPDGSQVPAYATPGAITASIGGTFTASASGTTLAVAAVLTGSLQVGDDVSGTDGTFTIPAGTVIEQQLTGQAGGTGTYLLNQAGTVGICTVTAASTVLNATAVGQGVLQIGQTLADGLGRLTPGTLITGLLAGAGGGPGLYLISDQQTVASEAMTTTSVLLAQVQPMSAGDLRHMDALNLQGAHRVLYVSAPLAGLVRPAVKGGDLATLPDGSVRLLTQPLENFYATAGWGKFAITLQNAS